MFQRMGVSLSLKRERQVEDNKSFPLILATTGSFKIFAAVIAGCPPLG